MINLTILLTSLACYLLKMVLAIICSGRGESEGWASEGTGTPETRLRLLTLQGQWLEIKGRMLAETGPSGDAKVRRGVLPPTCGGPDFMTGSTCCRNGLSFAVLIATVEEILFHQGRMRCRLSREER